MLTYSDFYDFTVYYNKQWKVKFTEKEIAENAYQLWVEFEKSKANNTCSFGIKSLIEQLAEDGSIESTKWIGIIQNEICDTSFRMKKYKVRIVETYFKYVDVLAGDEDRAYEIIDEKVYNGEIDLPSDGGDYKYDRELFVSEEVKEDE